MVAHPPHPSSFYPEEEGATSRMNKLIQSDPGALIDDKAEGLSENRRIFSLSLK